MPNFALFIHIVAVINRQVFVINSAVTVKMQVAVGSEVHAALEHLKAVIQKVNLVPCKIIIKVEMIIYLAIKII